MEYLRVISHAGLMGWLTFGTLFLMSILSWSFIVQKFFLFRRTEKNSKRFLDSFWKSRNLEKLYESSKKIAPSPMLKSFQEAYVELIKISKSSKENENDPINQTLNKIDNVERVLKRTHNTEISRLERFLSFLATTGSTAPFIGLFGTVVGVMRAFRQIGLSGSASLADVAPGISEALFATAAGLAAAIPAVVAYNFYRSKLRSIAADIDNFSADFLNIVKRHFIT